MMVCRHHTSKVILDESDSDEEDVFTALSSKKETFEQKEKPCKVSKTKLDAIFDELQESKKEDINFEKPIHHASIEVISGTAMLSAFG